MKKNDFKNMKVKKVEELRKTVSEKKTELTKLLSKKAASGEKNLKEGKASPTFDNSKDAIKWLEKQGILESNL